MTPTPRVEGRISVSSFVLHIAEHVACTGTFRRSQRYNYTRKAFDYFKRGMGDKKVVEACSDVIALSPSFEQKKCENVYMGKYGTAKKKRPN